MAPVVSLAFSIVASADDWPQWLGPDGNGVSREADWASDWPSGGPPRLWEAQLGEGCSAVSVAAGRAYSMGFKGGSDHVYCFDATTGKPAWEFTYPEELAPKMFEGGPTATPVVHDGLVYTVSRTGQLHCLDAATGRKVWSDDWHRSFSAKPPQWGYSGSPLVLKEWLITEPGAKGACLVAYERKTGKVAWKSGDYEAAYGSPMMFELGGKRRLATFNAQGLCLWDAENGRALGNLRWKTNYDVNAANPIFHAGRIFISSGYGTGCALVDVAETPKVVWQSKEMRNKHTNCVLWEEHLYGFDEVDLACIEWQTGAAKWRQPKLGRGTLILASGRLLILTEGGELIAARATPERFERLSSARICSERCWVMPVLANGLLYCRSNKGSLVCLDLKKR